MEKQTNKPTAGTWDRLPMSNEDRSPKISFDVNIPVEVTFLSDDPTERSSDEGGVYYSFDVRHNSQENVIQTSAWTLLGELKKHSPLSGKTLLITKKLEKGKQYFTVVAKQ